VAVIIDGDVDCDVDDDIVMVGRDAELDDDIVSDAVNENVTDGERLLPLPDTCVTDIDQDNDDDHELQHIEADAALRLVDDVAVSVTLADAEADGDMVRDPDEVCVVVFDTVLLSETLLLLLVLV
jgi:hypothetical protein